MIAVKKREVYRILDANYNRLKEGLRVCEDISRFILNDRLATRRFKRIRHNVSDSITALNYKELVLSRDIKADTGRGNINQEYSRKKIADVFAANAQRSKESLRVLEEISKLSKPAVSKKLKRIRYSLYDAERRTLEKL